MTKCFIALENVMSQNGSGKRSKTDGLLYSVFLILKLLNYLNRWLNKLSSNNEQVVEDTQASLIDLLSDCTEDVRLTNIRNA